MASLGFSSTSHKSSEFEGPVANLIFACGYSVLKHHCTIAKTPITITVITKYLIIISFQFSKVAIAGHLLYYYDKFDFISGRFCFV